MPLHPWPPSENSLKPTCTPKHIHPSLNHPPGVLRGVRPLLCPWTENFVDCFLFCCALESSCLGRLSAIKVQLELELVAARIEAPQRRSTRSVNEAKWAIFTKWCVTNQVDLRTPPVKSVADFLMYLFEDKKLQPSTIDGYRSAIADKLGNTTINISKDDNLT